jgi:hypothetical protein
VEANGAVMGAGAALTAVAQDGVTIVRGATMKSPAVTRPTPAIEGSPSQPKTLEPVPDPARPVYQKHHPGQPVVDHVKARSLGGSATDPENLHIKPWEWNSRKGAYEGQIRKEIQRYMKAGLSEKQARFVVQGELDWLENDVMARPMDPDVLDRLPAPNQNPGK